ncbi:hypothetical protein [Streptomyces sp. A0592]|uniref:hypothetical protein n=1 Tax=Streptomyces sp. A0592 TaxID=2563099 RepID=UPI00109E9E09|nr:hypothetical protein [Streptomyces sp. A0592]THA73701.1 hypothetical protein E6U81_38895 [Streptomyces sp. A0592]
MAGLGTGAQGGRQRRLCLIVDVEKYSGRSHRAQMRVQDGVAHALDYACERGGVRRQECALQDRGDGQLLLLPAGVDEAKAVPGLVQGLRDMLPVLNARAATDEQIRLRAALAQGSVQRAPLGFVAWSVELASRLLDSAELRTALAESAGSDMALIVSDDLYSDTFATGAGGLTGSAFRPVRVDLPEKRFSSDAWISVLPRGRTAPLGVAVAPPGGLPARRGRGVRAGGAALGVSGAYLLVRAQHQRDPEGHSADSPGHDERHDQHDQHEEHAHRTGEGSADMGHDGHEGEQTWDEGHLTESDVVESADGTGYTSVSDYVHGENGHEPDPHPVADWDDGHGHDRW